MNIPVIICVLQELGVVDYAPQFTRDMTSESSLGMFGGIKNYMYIIWVLSIFSIVDHASYGYCHGQPKIKVF